MGSPKPPLNSAGYDPISEYLKVWKTSFGRAVLLLYAVLPVLSLLGFIYLIVMVAGVWYG